MKKLLVLVVAATLLIGIAMAADTGTTAPLGSTDIYSVEIEETNSWTVKETVGDAPGMDEYRYYDGDFCWEHTWANSSDPGVYVMQSWLTIRAWDVDTGIADPEVDKIYADGVYIGDLDGADGEWSLTTLTVPNALVEDGVLEVCIDIDSTHSDYVWAVTVDKSMFYVKFDYGAISTPEFASIGIALAVMLTTPGFAYLVCRKRR